MHTKNKVHLSGLLRVVAVMLTLILCMSSCIASGGGTAKDPENLTTPDITLKGNTVSWTENELADKYEISINGHLSYIENSITEWKLEDGQTFKIRAIGDGVNYINSSWSSSVTYKAEERETAYYIVIWKNGDTILETDTNVAEGSVPEYNGAIPVRAGYVFVGWSPKINEIYEDAVYQAQFELVVVINTYTVIFKDHDGTVLKTETVESGKSAKAPDDPTREGYTFAGWIGDFTNVTANVEIVATYTENVPETYTVIFKDHDGTVLKTETVESGKSAKAPDDPTREGYTFAGWIGDFTNVISNVEVVATYTENVPETYTVIFKDHDGTVLKTETVESGNSATAPEDPTREGYIFIGWDKAFDNITEDIVVNAEYSILHNFIYSADHRVNPGEEIFVPIKILNNFGLCGFEIVITYDGNIVTPVSVAQSDLIIDGWFENSIETSTSASFSVVWSGVQNIEEDGELFIIKFIVNEEVDADFVIEISYKQENTINEDLEDVVLNCENIKISVEK